MDAKTQIQIALNRHEIKAMEPLFTDAQKIKNELRLDFETKADQDKIPFLLKEKTSQKNNLLTGLILCSLLEDMPQDAISNQIRNPLADYLLENQKQLIAPIQGGSEIRSCKWLSVYAKIKVNGNSTTFILNFIREQKEPLLQAQLLNQLDIKQVLLIPTTDRKYYRMIFQPMLKKRDVTLQNKMIYLRAISLFQREKRAVLKVELRNKAFSKEKVDCAPLLLGERHTVVLKNLASIYFERSAKQFTQDLFRIQREIMNIGNRFSIVISVRI